ncbi:hypothetical protein ES705_44372 [subsurface metagenome]
MSENNSQELKIYEVTNRSTGEKSYQPATNAEDACKQAGWLIGDCYVNPQKPHYETAGKGETKTIVKIPCQTCPFQYAECRKPDGGFCPARSTAPELGEWLKQAGEAHLCGYVGQSLTKKDYNLSLKTLKIEDAIKELSPKP